MLVPVSFSNMQYIIFFMPLKSQQDLTNCILHFMSCRRVTVNQNAGLCGYLNNLHLIYLIQKLYFEKIYKIYEWSR